MMRIEAHELTLFKFLINFRGLEAYVQKTIYNFLIVSCLLIRNSQYPDFLSFSDEEERIVKKE
jgi:hypothetical protein